MLLSIHRKNPLFAQNIHELLQLHLSLNPSIRLAHCQIGIFIYEAEFQSRIVQQRCNLRLIWMRIQIILCYHLSKERKKKKALTVTKKEHPLILITTIIILP